LVACGKEVDGCDTEGSLFVTAFCFAAIIAVAWPQTGAVVRQGTRIALLGRDKGQFSRVSWQPRSLIPTNTNTVFQGLATRRSRGLRAFSQDTASDQHDVSGVERGAGSEAGLVTVSISIR
jgi:hypothetical protein